MQNEFDPISYFRKMPACVRLTQHTASAPQIRSHDFCRYINLYICMYMYCHLSKHPSRAMGKMRNCGMWKVKWEMENVERQWLVHRSDHVTAAITQFCCSHVVWRVDQSPLFRIFSFRILPFVFCIKQFRILPNTRLIPLQVFTSKSSFVTTDNPNVKTHTKVTRSKKIDKRR